MESENVAFEVRCKAGNILEGIVTLASQIGGKTNWRCGLKRLILLPAFAGALGAVIALSRLVRPKP